MIGQTIYHTWVQSIVCKPSLNGEWEVSREDMIVSSEVLMTWSTLLILMFAWF